MAQTLRRGIKLSGTLLFGAYVAALIYDMILNTFGALAGYGCFWLSRKWFFRRFPEEEMR